jgi:restriction system protein
MARRSKSTVEGIFTFLLTLPPWMNLILGVGFYGWLEWIQQRPTSGKEGVLFVFAAHLNGFLVLGIFALLAATSALHRLRRGMLVDEQTGLDTLRETPWKDFEILVAEAYRRQGYAAKYSMDAGADGGVDIVLQKGGRTCLVQCKCWKVQSVGVAVIREMFGILHDQKADEVFIVTTGRFTQEAEAFAKGKPILLVNGYQLWEMVKVAQHSPVNSQKSPVVPLSRPVHLHAVAMLPEMNDPPPDCPGCGGLMVRRQARKGPSAGNAFWGCRSYPKCRGTLSLDC